MKRTGSALLEFNPELDRLSKDKALRDGLPVVVQIGNTLWVANDETISLERLSPESGSGKEAHKYAKHTQFPLNDFLQLPVTSLYGPETFLL